MKKIVPQENKSSSSIDEEKRDFLFITTAGLAVAGGVPQCYLL